MMDSGNEDFYTKKFARNKQMWVKKSILAYFSKTSPKWKMICPNLRRFVETYGLK